MGPFPQGNGSIPSGEWVHRPEVSHFVRWVHYELMMFYQPSKIEFGWHVE